MSASTEDRELRAEAYVSSGAGGPAPEDASATATAPVCIDARGLGNLINVSVRSIQRLDDAGKLPAPIVLGRSKRWLVEEVHAWLRAGAPPRKQWTALRRNPR